MGPERRYIGPTNTAGKQWKKRTGSAQNMEIVGLSEERNGIGKHYPQRRTEELLGKNRTLGKAFPSKKYQGRGTTFPRERGSKLVSIPHPVAHAWAGIVRGRRKDHILNSNKEGGGQTIRI